MTPDGVGFYGGDVDVVARLRRLPPSAVDVIVVAVVAVPTTLDAWWNEPGTRQADAVTYVLVALSVLALLFRRRWPLGVALVCGAALSVLYVLGHHGELLNLPVMVVLFTVAVQGDRRTTIVTAVVASVWSGVLGFTSDDPIGARGGSPVLEMLIPLVPLALGEAARTRRQLLAHARVEREREAQRRVEAERARMAREFHDVVAHTMAAVNVHMAAAEAAFDANPDTARRALHQARASSRAALQELRATVAFMRDDNDLAPVPRLDQIAELTDTARAAGITVTLHDDRAGVELSGAAELAAYRVVQEALANVLRHSNARRADVSLRRAAEGLVVEIVDDGTATPNGSTATSAPGYGLIGMAERVRAVDGRLDHGPTAGGGFRVRAVLPTAEGRS